MRLGIISDIHGVIEALASVIDDGRRVGVDAWWVLGDLVLFGPNPVEVIEALDGLGNVAFVRGNTDRYVLTDEQPHPHSTPEDAAADVDLVRRYGLMAAGAAWTRGVLDQAGALDLLASLPPQQRMVLPGGTSLLGVHASPGSDDGPGIDTTSSDEETASLLEGAEADWIVGGHTHDPTDRQVRGRRALNPGSVGLPRTIGAASWMVVTAQASGATVEHRAVGYDTAAVVDTLHRRRHPNRDFVESVLTRGTFLEAR